MMKTLKFLGGAVVVAKGLVFAAAVGGAVALSVTSPAAAVALASAALVLWVCG